MTPGRYSRALHQSPSPLPVKHLTLDSPGVQALRGKTPREIIHHDWEREVYGISEGDTIDVPLSQLIPDPQDMENVTGQSMTKYFKGKPFRSLPLIEVEVINDQLHILDGHHRYGYAQELGLQHVPVHVSQFRDNPLRHADFSIDDVIRLSGPPHKEIQ